MNASAQALSVSAVGKIANVSTIFQTQFPCTSVDFSPWVLEEPEQAKFDPDSIDMAFSFPTWQPELSCGCVLLQIYFSGDIQSSERTLRKLKLTGHDYRGQHWRLLTHVDRQFRGLFSGNCIPSLSGQQQFNCAITQIHTLFGEQATLPIQPQF